MSIASRLIELDDLKTALAENLSTMGQISNDGESLTDLVAKVLAIESVLTGDAVAADVLAGKEFYSDDPAAKLTGTLPDRGTVSTDISAKATEVTIAAGKHSGSGMVKIAAAEQAKIIAENIKEGVTILGVAGSLEEGVDTSDATATAGQIDEGATAYVNGVKITGTRKSEYNINTPVIEINLVPSIALQTALAQI